MIQRPIEMNAFEFVILSSLRAAQLMRGCIPLVESEHKVTMTAQLEVATGKIVGVSDGGIAPSRAGLLPAESC